MEWIDLTFDGPVENLAADEVLLDGIESGQREPTIRFWEPSSSFVVLGHGKKWLEEVDVAGCESLRIPILRRCSGGGTVLQGPGCLNYALVLPFDEAGELSTIQKTNRYVMERHRALFETLLREPVLVEGHTDLTRGGRKFSGNAQRRRRRSLLFHGTFLLRLDLFLMGQALRHPPIEPAYRGGRAHDRFLVNLELGVDDVKAALRKAWGARTASTTPPPPDFFEAVRQLAASRHEDPKWTRQC